MTVKVTNNGFSTLSAGITDSATTITLASGEGSRFPTLSIDDYFYGTLVDTSNNLEIVKVTARSTDSLTVVRAQDNTSARAFSTGDRFELRPVAKLFEDIQAKVGKHSIWIPASAMYPNTTNGCAPLAQVELSNGPELKVLDFDASADENAQFTVAFPKLWDEGTVTFQAFFTVTGTDTGTVAWGLSAVAIADNDSINSVFGTNVVATAKAHSGTSNDLNVSAESGAVTIAGSPSVDETCYFQLMRDVSADAQTGDARLVGIKLFFTTDALTDD